MRALALVATLATASVAAAAPDDVTIRADEVNATGLTGDAADAVVTASGDVRAEWGALLLRAPKLTFERLHRTATLEGGVVADDGILAFTAERLQLDVDRKTVQLTRGTLAVKKGVSAAELRKIAESPNPKAIATTGHNALLLRAERISRGEGRAFSADGVWLTTCDCRPDEEPLLAVSAGRVEVQPGDEATLHDWTFRIFGVRLLPFDAPFPLSIPLSSRRTGVLFPRLAYNDLGGFGGELPVFVTLGESADLTLRTRYFAGTTRADSRNDLLPGVRGFGQGLELRWRPAEESIGSARVDVVRDTSLDAFGRPRGWRTDAAFVHRQPLLGGRFAARGEVVSDSAVLFDTNVAIDRAQLPYLPSSATFSRPGVALESVAIQDLRGPAFAMPPPRIVRLPITRMPAVIAPVARADVSNLLISGPFSLDASALAAWEDQVPGLRLEPGRARRVGGEVALGQAWTLVGGPAGALTVDASERAQGFSPADGDAFGRFGAYGGLAGRVRIGRNFEGFRHEIVPSFRLRALYGTGGFAADLFQPRLPAGVVPDPSSSLRPPQSEIDLALRDGFSVQGVARLETSLIFRSGAAYTLFLEQHATAHPEVLGQGSFGASASIGPASLSLAGAVDFRTLSFVDATARAGLAVGTGRISLGGRYLSATLSDQLGRGLDELFSPVTRIAAGTTPLRQADASFDEPLGEAWRIQGGALLTRAVAPNATTTQQYWTGLSYDAGGCARVSVQVRWTPALAGQPPSFPAIGFAWELGDVGQAVAAAGAALVEPR